MNLKTWLTFQCFFALETNKSIFYCLAVDVHIDACCTLIGCTTKCIIIIAYFKNFFIEIFVLTYFLSSDLVGILKKLLNLPLS